METEKFWMVLRTQPVAGSPGPKVRHKSWIDAVAEATRLAAKEVVNFIVLEAVDEVTATPQPPVIEVKTLPVPVRVPETVAQVEAEAQDVPL